MTSFSNGAYSAEKGYDLRTPHNVPMGEIRSMRYVEPFSVSSLQKNTITYRLGQGPLPTGGPGAGALNGKVNACPSPPLIPATITTSPCIYAPKYDFCKRTYYLGVGSGLNHTPSKTNIMRLVQKNLRIK